MEWEGFCLHFPHNNFAVVQGLWVAAGSSALHPKNSLPGSIFHARQQWEDAKDRFCGSWNISGRVEPCAEMLLLSLCQIIPELGAWTWPSPVLLPCSHASPGSSFSRAAPLLLSGTLTQLCLLIFRYWFSSSLLALTWGCFANGEKNPPLLLLEVPRVAGKEGMAHGGEGWGWGSCIQALLQLSLSRSCSKVGLDDPGGFFQPRWFCEMVSAGLSWAEGRADSTSSTSLHFFSPNCLGITLRSYSWELWSVMFGFDFGAEMAAARDFHLNWVTNNSNSLCLSFPFPHRAQEE